MQRNTFWPKFGSLSPAVTLNISSRSPKPNQLFFLSHCYIQANFVKTRQPVHEISCSQETVTLTRNCEADANANTEVIWIHTQSICPPPIRCVCVWGGGGVGIISATCTLIEPNVPKSLTHFRIVDPCKLNEADEKATIRNDTIEFHILPQTPNGK